MWRTRGTFDDVEEDEQDEAPMDFGGDSPDGPDDPDEPPRQRRRLTPLPRLDSGDDLRMDFEDCSYEPTTPGALEDVLDLDNPANVPVPSSPVDLLNDVEPSPNEPALPRPLETCSSSIRI